MTLYRSLLESVFDNRAELPSEEIHHLTRVRRGRPGDHFIGVDGRGGLYECSLERDGGKWFGRIVKTLECNSEPPVRITLAQALVKKDKFEWVIQKATELGVSEIVPLITVRSELRLNEERTERRVKRWNRILREALKQSGRCLLPALEQPCGLADFLDRNESELSLVLDEEGGRPLGDLLPASRPAGICVLVGPEGGWDGRERDLFAAAGVKRAHLGPRVLRAETAPVVVLSILQYVLGDLGDRAAASPSAPEETADL